MKKLGNATGLIIGIPLFILIINFLFIRGNNPEEEEINTYIKNSIIDTIEIKATFPKGEQYIVGVNRRGRPSAFLFKYPFYLKKGYFLNCLLYSADQLPAEVHTITEQCISNKPF